MFFLRNASIILLFSCAQKGGDGTETATPPSESGTTPPPPTTTLDPATVRLAGACPMETDWGGFRLESYPLADPSYSLFDGTVANGVIPVTVLLPVGCEGDCQLLQRQNPFCDPPCDPQETCDLTETCVAAPVGQDVGTVTVTGLTTAASMDPVAPTFTYFDVSLDDPPYAPGDTIVVRSSGGDWPPMEMFGVGVEPIAIPDTSLVLTQDQDLHVAWTAPVGAAVRSTIYFRITIDQHGNTPVQLQCETADDGSIDVPASLVSQLIGFGVTGFPNAVLYRHTVDSQPLGDGCVQFEVRSEAEPSVEVAGFVPCVSNDDCPTGSDCNIATGLCE
jgi:hypothetical protein